MGSKILCIRETIFPDLFNENLRQWLKKSMSITQFNNVFQYTASSYYIISLYITF